MLFVQSHNVSCCFLVNNLVFIKNIWENDVFPLKPQTSSSLSHPNPRQLLPRKTAETFLGLVTPITQSSIFRAICLSWKEQKDPLKSLTLMLPLAANRKLAPNPLGNSLSFGKVLGKSGRPRFCNYSPIDALAPPPCGPESGYLRNF